MPQVEYLGFVPAAARLLPRPGAWMERFKQLMAFPLYLSVVWLVWVVARQLDVSAGAQLLVGLVLIAFVLHRFVQGQIDQRLDAQIAILSSMLQVGKDGQLKLAGTADGPPFDRPMRGWYWKISGPTNVLRSRSLGAEDFELPDLGNRPAPPPPPRPPVPPPAGAGACSRARCWPWASPHRMRGPRSRIR